MFSFLGAENDGNSTVSLEAAEVSKYSFRKEMWTSFGK